MAKTFGLRGMLVPSQGRKASSQGGGMPGGGAVAIGTPQESASTVINNINNVTNIVGGDYSKIVRITISDLLALDPTEVGENDLYIVYASGSDEDGWSGDPFEYDGETYPAESFFQLINGEWQAITDEIDLSKSPKFGNLPEEVYVVEGLFPQTSFPNIYGRNKAGMQIAKVRRYRLDDAGVYQPVKESTGTPGGGTSVNDMWSINVPYAHSYVQGGTTHYEGGLLTAEDYRRLKERQETEEIYIAYYGETTFDELVDAYEAGKFIVLKDGSITAVLGYYYVNEFRFYRVDIEYYNATAKVTCFSISFNDGWRMPYNTTVENRGDRVPSTELAPRLLTDNKYLSALSVKILIEEYIADLATVASSGDYDDLINKPTIPSAVTDAVKYSAQSLTDAQKAQARQNIGAGAALTFDTTPTANSANPVTSGGIASALNNKANTDLSNLAPSAITNTRSGGERIATIGGVDIYETGRETKSTLDTSSSASFVSYNYVTGVYETRSASLLWNWFKANNNVPNFTDNHSQNPSARTQAAFYVGRDGVWWYDGMTTATGWYQLATKNDVQWNTSTTYVYKEDYVCSVSGTDGSRAKLTVADFINSINNISRWFRYSLTFDGTTTVTGYIDPNWRKTNDNSQVAIFVYGKTNSTYASVDALYADFVKMEISASLYLTEQKKLIKDNIFSSIEVTTYTVSGVSVPAIKFAFNQNIIPKLWATGTVPFTINIEARRVGNIDDD